MKSILNIAVVATSFLVLPINQAFAEEKASELLIYKPAKQACGFNETTTITINLNSTVELASQAKDQIKQYEEEVNEFASQAKADLVELTRMNFSLNSNNRFQQNNNDSYKLSGSISFKIAPYENALKVLDQLKGKGYTVSLNVSSYKNNC